MFHLVQLIGELSHWNAQIKTFIDLLFFLNLIFGTFESLQFIFIIVVFLFVQFCSFKI